MNVDESRGDNLTARIDYSRAAGLQGGRDGNDHISGNRYVSAERGIPSAVDNPAAANHQIKRGWLLRSASRLRQEEAGERNRR